MILATGPTLLLRDMALRDLESWRHWMQPGHKWRELDGPYYRQDTTSASIDEAVEKHRARLSSGKARPDVRERAVVVRRSDDALLGQVSRYWISQETDWAALGVVIYDPTLWRSGLGYQALGLWTDYQFENEHRFVRLDLRTWSGNMGMMHLAQKLGYREEARFRMARIVKGAYYDGLGYGLLRDEWTARYPQGFAGSLEDTRGDC